MSEDEKQWANILRNVTTKTKLLGLIALITSALFVGALTRLENRHVLFALLACVAVLLVTIIGIVVDEITEARTARPDRHRLTPSPPPPRSEFLSELINTAIETVCRAVSLPQTPQAVKLRVFIFRRE